MEIREESGLRFRFPDDSKIIKFDDTVFYRKFFNTLPDSKGVDFIAAEKDSLSFIEIEVPEKVAMTLAALAGAKSFEGSKTSVEELKDIQNTIFSEDFSDDKKKKYVILFLEGDFGGHTRTKKMIMSELQKSMNVKMRWLNCKVSVVDSSTYDEKIFRIV